jgi:hypothetical protein
VSYVQTAMHTLPAHVSVHSFGLSVAGPHTCLLHNFGWISISDRQAGPVVCVLCTQSCGSHCSPGQRPRHLCVGLCGVYAQVL